MAQVFRQKGGGDFGLLAAHYDHRAEQVNPVWKRRQSPPPVRSQRPGRRVPNASDRDTGHISCRSIRRTGQVQQRRDQRTLINDRKRHKTGLDPPTIDEAGNQTTR